jgi:hypothetical protein
MTQKKLEFTEYRNGQYRALPGVMFYTAAEEVLAAMTGDTVFVFNDTSINVYVGSCKHDLAEKFDLKRDIARLKQIANA